MNTNDMVAEIDAEISRLQQVKALLTGGSTPEKRRAGRPAKIPPSSSKATSFNPVELTEKPAKRRTMSAEGRAKIAEAQKLRWAKSKKAEKKAPRKALTAGPKKTTGKAAPRKKASKKALTAKKAPQTSVETTPASAS